MRIVTLNSRDGDLIYCEVISSERDPTMAAQEVYEEYVDRSGPWWEDIADWAVYDAPTPIAEGLIVEED